MRRGATYLALGDSTTWTQVTTGADLYPHRLRAAIRAAHGPLQLLNKGIGGATSANLVASLPWLLPIQADLITLCVGMNDSSSLTVSVVNYTANLTTLVDRIQEQNPDAAIILCAPNRTTDANRTPYIADYRAAMAGVATAAGVGYVDFSTAWSAGSDATYLPDGIHPNTAGHALMHDVLWPYVQTYAADLLAEIG